MSSVRPLTLARLGIVYFLLAALAVRLTRYDGGVAFLWLATSYLIAEMSVVSRRAWSRQLAVAGFASLAATSLWGFGWKAAPVMAAANMLEAYAAAHWLRQQVRQSPLHSLAWFGRFASTVAITAPLVSAPIAMTVGLALGNPPVATFVHWFTGHALGNLTFAPIFILLLQGKFARLRTHRKGRSARETLLLLGLSLATTTGCFLQTRFPLLFLPVLPLILITFRLGRSGAVTATMMLALVGGGLTLAGYGPVQLMTSGTGMRLQFFQFYLAATVLTIWPVAADLQNRSRLHRELRVSEERYRLLADHSTDILMHIDADGIVHYVSPSIWQLGGYAPEELVGCNALAVIAPEYHAMAMEEHRLTLAQPSLTRSFEYEALTRAGERRWFETRSRAIVDEDGRSDGTMNIVRDISSRKETERFLARAASTDALTGLPNRRAFRLAVERRAMIEESQDCVALLDIDHFKRVNDRFGHDGGDEVLRHFAAVARRMVRQHDFVARMGGEEFAILFADTSLEQAMLVCERLRQEIAAATIELAGVPLAITVSGGVAAVGSDGVDEALKIADLALYEAKESGRDRMSLAA
ncbi:sensor domain-containing diguanylate cyclase [Sphingomonas ginkgonis]|uniref:diguanylate cyclase n=1 Tax=Sphingomonas ginkgonis TaxID=2315330 RepID=A0A3S0ELS3_9SPHN|nr:sensor domain-containing diguanylate cyclase [Sphingomonas ginkgonis]RST30493.1 sensor domain-containing diguanylate cyclase [Sphingomonas ginkgonis]